MTERSERRRLKKRVLALLNTRLDGIGVRFEQHGGKCVLVSGKWHHVAGMEWESVEAAFTEVKPGSLTVPRYFISTYEMLSKAGADTPGFMARENTYRLFGPAAVALRPFVGCRSLEELELRLEAFG